MDEAVKQLLSDLMINSHIPVTPISESSTPSSPLHIDNNLLDSIILPESSQHADPSTTNTEHPNPILSVHETHNPNTTHPIPGSPNLSRNEPDIDPPNNQRWKQAIQEEYDSLLHKNLPGAAGRHRASGSDILTPFFGNLASFQVSLILASTIATTRRS